MTTTIIRGTHFVGEVATTKAVPRQFKQDPMVFEDFSHAEETLAQYRRDDEHAVAERDKLKQYLYFWAKVRRYENNTHEIIGGLSPCPSCGICRCGAEPSRFTCMCSEGKKMVSPYRIAFINSGEKTAWHTSIWEIGRGWTPKKNQSLKHSLGARGLD
jgi:hypothetical protein